jgi:hypothetical protein
MPDSRPPSRLRHRFAAFSIVGALMIMLPLVQVLRYQAAEIQAVLAERAALDPMAHAVAVQRALLTHRDLAGRVLRGRLSFEPERKRSQGDVDVRLATLAGTLAAGPWERALEESNALGEDWQQLAREVAARRITASASDQAHRLRIEQTLQVIDHVAVTLAPADAGGPPTSTVVAQTLPGLARQIATLTPAEHATEAADAAALLALVQRFDEARQRQARLLEQRAALLEGHRNLLLAAMAALLAVAVLLAGRLVRRPATAAPQAQAQAEAGAPATPAAASAGPSATRETAQRLLQRLRHGDSDAQLRSAGMASGSAALPPVTGPGKTTSD